MKRFLVAGVLLLALGAGTPSYAQISHNGPDTAIQLGPEWHYVFTVDSGYYTTGVQRANGDTLIGTFGGPRSYSTDFGNTWDTMCKWCDPNLPGRDWLHTGRIIQRVSDSALVYIVTFDFGRSWDTAFVIPDSISRWISRWRGFTRSDADPVNDLWLEGSVSRKTHDQDYSEDYFARSTDAGKSWFPARLPPPPLDGSGNQVTLGPFDMRNKSRWYVTSTAIEAWFGSTEQPVPHYWMTTHDGKSFMEIDELGCQAGIAYEGEMRCWESGISDTDSLKVYGSLTRGYTTWPAGDNTAKKFVDIMNEISLKKPNYVQLLYPIQAPGIWTYGGQYSTSYAIMATEYLDSPDSFYHDYQQWTLLTVDDGATLIPLIMYDSNRFGHISGIDPNGRIWAVISRGNSSKYLTSIPRHDIYYSDTWASLITARSGVPVAPIEPGGIGVAPTAFSNSASSNFVIRLDRSGEVSVGLSDMLGRRMLSMYNGFHPAGELMLTIPAEPRLASGLYFLTILVDGKPFMQKILIE